MKNIKKIKKVISPPRRNVGAGNSRAVIKFTPIKSKVIKNKEKKNPQKYTLSFSKMSASGNDFIVIDNRRRTFNTNPSFIQQLCAFHTGIGADGVLLLEKSNITNFKMRIFNPDGSEPNMCGNGARCIGLYAWEHKLIPQKYSMETLAGIIKGEIVSSNKIKIFLGKPKDIRLNLSVQIESENLKIHSINTGVPHAIIYLPYINKIDVQKLGKEVRWSPLFQPNGTNVDFVQILGKNRISVRTYERGVEGETLACGTGVTASAIISALVHNLKSTVYVETKNGDILIVDINEVSLTGPAKVIFEGKIEI